MAFRFSCQKRNRSFPRPTQRPRLETLETRENPAIIQWTNPVGGDWNNPANWDLGRLPAAQDDVIIDVPGAVTITHSSGNTTVQSIQSQEALVLNGGVLDVNGPMHVAGGISFSSATLRDAIVSASTTINASIATLDGVTLNGVLNLPNSLQVVNGLTVNGTINASGFAAHLRFQGSQTLGGTGTALFGNAYGLLAMGASDVLTIGAGFTARGFNFGVGALAEAGAQGTFVNYGTLISDNAAGGVLGLSGDGWVNHGTVTINPGKIFYTNYYNPTKSWTNQGTISLNGATGYLYASQWTNLGTLEVRGGTALTDYSQTTNFSGNTLTGGTWKVGPNTSLRLNIGDIATLNSNIILEGANSNLLKAATNTSALTPLATIGTTGGLTLAGGRELTLNQNLTTSGNLVVERTSRLTIPGPTAAITQLAGTTRIDGTLTLGETVGTLPQPVPYSGNFLVQGGVVQGSGLIQANVTNQGTLQPGSPLGRMTIAGNLTQSSGSTVEVQLGGTIPGGSVVAGSKIDPVTYEMPNGDTGQFVYWDETYSNGPVTADNQYLSGGKGQLTDGVIAPTNWNGTPYPYVGWGYNRNPEIKFHLDQTYTIFRVRVHLDDSNGYGDVNPPPSITIGAVGQPGTTYQVPDPASGAPFWFEANLENVRTSDLFVKINNGNTITMVSEIEIYGDPAAGFYDQLGVMGSATLDGTLAVGTLNGFVPAPTDSFRVLTFASKTGDFATYAPITPGLTIPTRTFDPTGLTLGAVLAGNADPIANAGPDLAANEGDTVSFDASASYDPNQDSLSYLWDFGDGNTATGLNPTHTYADNGTYTVTLTATDPHGATATDTLTVTVANVAPTVTLNAPSAATVGKAFSIQVSATDPSTSDTQAGFTYSIDWGDGSTRSGGRLSKKYSTPGQYTISVIATDKDGASSIVQTQTVTVSGAVFQIGSVGVGLFDRSETTAASGSSNDDTIQGALNASNWIDGGWGADTITGGNQADLLFSDRGTQGNAALSNDADADELVGVRTQSSGVTTGEVETLIGMGGDDLLFGAGATDILYGDSTNTDDPLVSGNDLLVGYGGDDQLFGGYGDDTLVGGIGNDLLDGGQGLDEASWRDLSFEGTGDHVAGVVLNLSSTTVQYQSGLRKGDSAIWIDGVRIAEADQAPIGSIGWGGNIVRDVAAMTAKHKLVNNWLNSTDTIVSIEVFEGSRQTNDVAVLSSGFQALGQPDDDGYQAYTNGTTTYWFKDFETVVILPAPV